MQSKTGSIVAICISTEKGKKKTPQNTGNLIQNFGLEHDAHAGDWHRQVSLLAQESIDKMISAGIDVGPGDFAENITTSGLVLNTLPIGTRFKLGDDAILELTQIGKTCHERCEIFYQAGDCVMPREGIFAKVITPGRISDGDTIEILLQVEAGSE